MIAPERRAVALLIADRAKSPAAARLLLDVLGLIDGPDARALAEDEQRPQMSAHDRVGHDVVLAELPGRPSTVPEGLRLASTAPAAPSRAPRAPSPQQPAVCGTRAGYRRHLKAGEVTCQPCRDVEAERVRNRPDRQPKKRRAQAACGTTSGYVQHLKQEEPTCRACKDAMAAYSRARTAAKRAGQ